MSAKPTPATFRRLANWLDDERECPVIIVIESRGRGVMASEAMRQIADRLELQINMTESVKNSRP